MNTGDGNITKKPCWSGKAATHLVWYFKGETILLNSLCHHLTVLDLKYERYKEK